MTHPISQRAFVAALTKLEGEVCDLVNVPIEGYTREVLNALQKKVNDVRDKALEGIPTEGSVPQEPFSPPCRSGTVLGKLNASLLHATEDRSPLFAPDEIIEQCPFEAMKKACQKTIEYGRGCSVSLPVFAYYTRHKKAVLQQQCCGLGADVKTAWAMLAMDHGEEVKVNQSLFYDSSRFHYMSPIIFLTDPATYCSMSNLHDAIKRLGCGICTLTQPQFRRVIIDKVCRDETKIKLRESYSAQNITLTAHAFFEQKPESIIVQVLRQECYKLASDCAKDLSSDNCGETGEVFKHGTYAIRCNFPMYLDLVTFLPSPTLRDYYMRDLAQAIKDHGSGICTLNHPTLRRVIIDGICEEKGKRGIRLRDPYSATEITITEDAFFARKPEATIVHWGPAKPGKQPS